MSHLLCRAKPALQQCLLKLMASIFLVYLFDELFDVMVLLSVSVSMVSTGEVNLVLKWLSLM